MMSSRSSLLEWLATRCAPVGSLRRSGGAANLVTVDACTTRLRLVVARQEAVNVDALKRLGARGVVRPGADAVQVVLGPVADQVAGGYQSGTCIPARVFVCRRS